VRLPPLRERRDDVPLLVHFLVNKFALRIGKRLDGVSRETMQRLQEYSWPGNIRELENVLERAVILTIGATLDIAPDLLPTLPARTAEERTLPKSTDDNRGGAVALQPSCQPQPTLEAVERDYILSVLRQTNWLITGPRGAAKVLDLNPTTLRNRMKKLGITRAR
jgi:formate hydrogenlyase transcriptional activator